MASGSILRFLPLMFVSITLPSSTFVDTYSRPFQMDLRDQDIHNMDQGAIEIGAACVTQPSDVEAHAGGVSGSSAVANAPMDQQI